MNDQPRPNPHPRRRPPIPERSRESRFIGYLVLGFGALAIIAVLMLAFGGGDKAYTPEQASLQKELAAAQATAQPVQPQPEEGQLYLRRQKKIDIEDLEGGWQAMIGEYLTVLQIQKGAFQIIMALPDPQMPRRYFSGTYAVMDDIVVLKPQLKWGPPKKPEGSPVIYTRLTTSTVPMIVGFDGGKMVWQNIPPGTEKRIYVPARSPLLSQAGQDYIIWTKTD